MTARATNVERAAMRCKVVKYTNKKEHDVANLAAAHVIASDPVTYPAGSLAATWAARIRSELAHDQICSAEGE